MKSTSSCSKNGVIAHSFRLPTSSIHRQKSFQTISVSSGKLEGLLPGADVPISQFVKISHTILNVLSGQIHPNSGNLNSNERLVSQNQTEPIKSAFFRQNSSKFELWETPAPMVLKAEQSLYKKKIKASILSSNARMPAGFLKSCNSKK